MSHLILLLTVFVYQTTEIKRRTVVMDGYHRFQFWTISPPNIPLVDDSSRLSGSKQEGEIHQSKSMRQLQRKFWSYCSVASVCFVWLGQMKYLLMTNNRRACRKMSGPSDVLWNDRLNFDHPRHDDECQHCPSDVGTRLKKYFRGIRGRILATIKHHRRNVSPQNTNHGAAHFLCEKKPDIMTILEFSC